MEELKIIDLIVLFLKGKLQPEELTKLDNWVVESEENRRFFLSLMDAETFRIRKKERQEVDFDRIFNKIKRRKKRLSPRKWMMAASIVLVVGISGFGLRWFMHPSSPEIISSNEIVAGQSRAMLTLAGGEQIVLEKQDTLICDENTRIQVNAQGMIVYPGENVPGGAEMTYNRIETGRGGEYRLILSDGTEVWLNAETELYYPVGFSSEERRVTLRGEAYFQVARNEEQPFIVETSRSAVKVLGTEFCIRDYSGRPNRTTLVSGSVAVEDLSGGSFTIEPGQQVCIEEGKGKVEEVEPFYYTAWKEGYFIFHEAPLEQIMEELAQWYDFSCFFENPGLAGKKMDARLKKYDEIGVVLDILSQTGDVKFEQKGRVIIVKAMK